MARPISDIRQGNPVQTYVTPVPFSTLTRVTVASSIPKPPPISPTSKAERPELDPPAKVLASPSASIAAFMETVSRIGRHFFEIVQAATTSLQGTFNADYQEHAEALAKSEEEKEGRDFWDFLRKIAICLFGAASIIIGGIALATATAIAPALLAGAMIFSGIASLVGNSLHAAGIKPTLATVLTLVGSATAVIGGVVGAHLGILSLQGILSRMVLGFLNFSINATKMAGTIKEIKITSLEGRLAQLRSRMTLSEETMQQISSDFTHSFDTSAGIAESCIRAHQKEIRLQESINKGRFEQSV